MKKIKFFPLIIPELFIAWIINLIVEGDFFQVFFYVSLAPLALVYFLLIVKSLRTETESSHVFEILFLSLFLATIYFLLPWLVSIVFKINFFKVYLIVHVLILFLYLLLRNKNSN